MVRSDGNRGSIYEALFGELVKKPPDQIDAFFELPLFKDDQTKSMWVRFVKAKTAIIDAFDLTVFQSDGSSRIKFTGEMPSGLTPSWAKRFEVLKNTYKSALDTYSGVASGTDVNALNLIRCQLLRMSDDIAPNEIDIQNQEVRYKIKRVGRLRNRSPRPCCGTMPPMCRATGSSTT